jgi:hypothetical protein
MEQYYKLKQKYETVLNRRKSRIKADASLTVKEKRAAIKKIIPKCVNCGKAGGTIFEEKNGMLKAVCGSKTPCNLNINLRRTLFDNVHDLEKKNDKQIENLKMRIIMTKLDYLFGLNNSKDETVDKFNTLKKELATISEKQILINRNYGDILSGINRDPLLNDANMDLANEIDELKKIYNEYNIEKKQIYINTMIEKYINTILPLTEQIRNIKYGYYNVEYRENEPLEDNDIYVLVANPYRFEQFEQERK